jgi:hypothetical protein
MPRRHRRSRGRPAALPATGCARRVRPVVRAGTAPAGPPRSGPTQSAGPRTSAGRRRPRPPSTPSLNSRFRDRPTAVLLRRAGLSHARPLPTWNDGHATGVAGRCLAPTGPPDTSPTKTEPRGSFFRGFFRNRLRSPSRNSTTNVRRPSVTVKRCLQLRSPARDDVSLCASAVHGRCCAMGCSMTSCSQRFSRVPVGQFARTLRAHRFGRRTERPSRLRVCSASRSAGSSTSRSSRPWRRARRCAGRR